MLARIFGRWQDVGVVVVRIVLGVIFIAHGGGKLFGIWGGHGISGVAGFMGKLGFNPPMLWAVVLAVTEFFGGIFVLIGFLTRWAALGLAIAMLVAILKVHLGQGLLGDNQGSGYEFPLALLAMALFLLFNGARRFSLDAVLKRDF